MSARKRFKQSKLTSFLAVNDEESHSVHQTGASTAGNRSGSADNDSLGSGDGNVNFEKMTTAGTSTGNSVMMCVYKSVFGNSVQPYWFC